MKIGVIGIGFVGDTPSEKSEVENGHCHFSVTEREDMLHVTTKEDDEQFRNLSEWKLVMPGLKGCLKRFHVELSRETFISHLQEIYGHENVAVLE